MATVAKEYKTISQIAGPLVFVKKTEPVGYKELVSVRLSDGSIKRGEVLDSSDDMVVVQIFEGTTGIDRSASVRFLGETMKMPVSKEMLGRVLNGAGDPLDGGAKIVPEKELDIAGAAITITEERAKKVSFTQPYYDSGLSILVRKADKDTYKTDKDLKNKILCGQLGTSGAAYARTIEGATVKTFNTMNETYMELRNKGCEAVIGDRPTIAYFMTSNARNKKLFTLQDTVLNVEQFGFIVAKDNKKLLARLDKAFEEAKKDGSYKALLVKWFGQ